MEFNRLTSEEEAVIMKKATEKPFSGRYDNFFEEGKYICRRCNFPLYESKNKFDAHCGWPSFDEEIPGSIKREIDVDGLRTEIICANCGAHLGHVFIGEKMTPKNTRYCVNSISMYFVPQNFKKGEQPFIVLGGGCFWCLYSIYKQVRGVIKVTAGYSGGHIDHPTYEQVCSQTTGHAEVVKIEYDPNVINYGDILEIFFTVHDPTSLNQQGSDVGEQYRSIILYVTWQQRVESEKFFKKIIEEKIYNKPIVTELKPLIVFYPAEDYHQDYYAKNPNAGYCQLVINPKLKKFREKFKEFLK
ncbi:MAG: bifunctional methionine sulfoxide reductase B/A protein [Candidatus Magasanikbacteria bacterium]|nr:bifunctional methionine sulfoxide reductase B/A protein [Candidatus Magasanikbacteria bacterium]